MLLQQISADVLLIRNNSWSRDWISPAFFIFLSGLWDFLFYPLIYPSEDSLVYYLTHVLLLTLLVLNWPITESVTLDRSKQTVTLKKKLFFSPTEYTTTLAGAKSLKTEKYKNKIRLAIAFADGMAFPLSTAYFPSRLVPDSVAQDIRSFLGLKLRKRKHNSRSKSRSASPSIDAAPVRAQPEEKKPKLDSDSDSDAEFSDSEVQNDIDWDKAIEDWEAEVRERKTFH